MSGARIISLKHADVKNCEIGFLLFGSCENELDELLRRLTRLLPCFRKFWEFHEVIEYLTDEAYPEDTLPETIKSHARFMTNECLESCWLFVNPLVTKVSPLHLDYIRLKHFILRLKDCNGHHPRNKIYHMTAANMKAFRCISGITVDEAFGAGCALRRIV